MMPTPSPGDIADQLWEAAARGKPVEPIATSVAAVAEALDRSPESVAYEVQQINTERVVAERATRVCGRKIGLTSIAVQRQLGVNRPDFGSLFADRYLGDGGMVDTRRLLAPRVEPEIALVLGSDLRRGQHTVADVIRATEFVLPAIEIVDSRIADWKIGFLDTVADNASGDSFVLGNVPYRLDGLDLSSIRIEMSVDGQVASTGIGADCLGNPLLAAVWLADVLDSLGTPLRAGDVVLTGAVAAMAPLPACGVVVADFGQLGSVTLTTEVNE